MCILTLLITQADLTREAHTPQEGESGSCGGRMCIHSDLFMTSLSVKIESLMQSHSQEETRNYPTSMPMYVYGQYTPSSMSNKTTSLQGY